MKNTNLTSHRVKIYKNKFRFGADLDLFKNFYHSNKSVDGKLKILLVDDNRSITKVISQYLTVQGHQCSVSNDGKTGLNLIQSEKFDVLVLDLAMPGFTGFDMLDSLEEKGLLKSLKIIILTAAELSENQIENMIKRGVKKVLKKPIPLNVLEKNL